MSRWQIIRLPSQLPTGDPDIDDEDPRWPWDEGFIEEVKDPAIALAKTYHPDNTVNWIGPSDDHTRPAP